MADKKRLLAYAILEFLDECTKDGTLKDTDKESIEDHQRDFSIKPASLTNIFDVFIPAATASPSKKEISKEDIEKAEDLKTQGNQKMTARDYINAIRLRPTVPRCLDIANGGYMRISTIARYSAAAYSQAGEHQKAVDDAKTAAKVDPNYSKAYSRLGLGQYQEAADAYKRGLELDPTNSNMQVSLETAKKKLAATSPSADAGSSSVETTDRGMPDFGAGGMPNFGAGGMPDIGSLLSNPAMRDMAMRMMQNPQMMQMAQQMMGGAGGSGGSGGMPDMSALMNNPELMNM
ncbi:hypothetical protein THASP1DRAFT_21517 [Thamnocephalis sphaerospora]|uniref:Uncharacterized protein n=1 Tax=Thamnocephalis sphaerospora TaxID=78915 RepID=A0A4P9XYM4_9FUNG|nr:hypothetical protein THASP1DRAFT_21517 [Thamnocephalis sphaerospora]|eukprot:RKP10801.1 hypothetical protein THASP1DRAFT_21517 [Thamnocephalis sphaerospora]